MTYVIYLSQYGLIVNKGSVKIKAKSKREAIKKALKMCENNKVKFTQNTIPEDGWEFQIVSSEKLK